MNQIPVYHLETKGKVNGPPLLILCDDNCSLIVIFHCKILCFNLPEVFVYTKYGNTSISSISGESGRCNNITAVQSGTAAITKSQLDDAFSTVSALNC